jgi:midasin
MCRGEIYIPELNRSFACPAGGVRVFACQNPLAQGGGRKGLPKSFLNRFTQVSYPAGSVPRGSVCPHRSSP